ncbi:MAG TPA: MFS transporter, partial [Anaerolineaceae bacterium]
IGYLLMSRASTLGEFAVLMGMSGLFQPLYRVGADSMLADLIPMDRRADAYSILRMSNNIGVSLGPAIGGFIASASYTTAFFFASAGMLIYSLLVAFRARETIPVMRGLGPGDKESGSGYGRVFGDRPYMAFILTLTLVQSASALVWVLLGVYAKQNYGVAENQYGLIPTTNALMVVFLQVLVTAVTKRRPPLLMMAAGAMFYAVGVGSVAFGTGFWGFWLSMIVITCGELVLMPTSSTYAANLAPPAMRGRYLSLYGLTWSLASGIGPILGGYLNDQIAPQAIWYGGFVLGLASALGFLLLSRRNPALGSAGAANPPNPD